MAVPIDAPREKSEEMSPAPADPERSIRIAAEKENDGRIQDAVGIEWQEPHATVIEWQEAYTAVVLVLLHLPSSLQENNPDGNFSRQIPSRLAEAVSDGKNAASLPSRPDGVVFDGTRATEITIEIGRSGF